MEPMSERYEHWKYDYELEFGPEGEERNLGPFLIYVDISCQEIILHPKSNAKCLGPKKEPHPYFNSRGYSSKVEEIVFDIKGKSPEWMPTVQDTINQRVKSEKASGKKSVIENFTDADAVTRLIQVLSHYDKSLIEVPLEKFIKKPAAIEGKSKGKSKSKGKDKSESKGKSKGKGAAQTTTTTGTTNKYNKWYVSVLKWDDPSLETEAEIVKETDSYGATRHFRGGRLHREDGPAVEGKNYKTFYLFGKYFDEGAHAEAVKKINEIRSGRVAPPKKGGWTNHTSNHGVSEYRKGAKLHREDGPAYKDQKNNVEKYYLDGEEYDKKSYWSMIDSMSKRKRIASYINDAKKTSSSSSLRSQSNNKWNKSTTSTSTSTSTSSNTSTSSKKHTSRHGKPEVWVTPTAWQKMSYWAYLGGKQRQEITCFGRTVKDKRGRIRVVDAYLIEQEGTSASVDGDDSSINKLMVELFKQGIEPEEAFGCWIHSHPGTGPSATYLSSVDEANIERILNHEYLVSIVLDQVGQNPYCRVDIKNPRVSFECSLKVEVPGSTHAWRELDDLDAVEHHVELKDAKKQFQEKVKRGGYSGYYSGLSSGVNSNFAFGGIYGGGWDDDFDDNFWESRYYNESRGDLNDPDDIDWLIDTTAKRSHESAGHSKVEGFLIVDSDGFLDEETPVTKALWQMSPESRADYLEMLDSRDLEVLENEMIDDLLDLIFKGKISEREAIELMSECLAAHEEECAGLLKDAVMNNEYVDTKGWSDLSDEELLGVPKEISSAEDQTDRQIQIEISTKKS